MWLSVYFLRHELQSFSIEFKTLPNCFVYSLNQGALSPQSPLKGAGTYICLSLIHFWGPLITLGSWSLDSSFDSEDYSTFRIKTFPVATWTWLMRAWPGALYSQLLEGHRKIRLGQSQLQSGAFYACPMGIFQSICVSGGKSLYYRTHICITFWEKVWLGVYCLTCTNKIA